MAFDYDQYWSTEWDDMKKYGPMSRHGRRITKQIVRRLHFDSILDVGCGQGSLLAELLSEFPGVKLSGIDISPQAIELARRRVPGGQFSVADIQQECLNQAFDLVICNDVLEHIPDDQVALENIARMTRKHLLVSTVQGRMRRFEPQAVGHVRNYDRDELGRKIEGVGLKVLQVIEFGFPFYSPIYRDLLELTGAKVTTGEFGWMPRLLSSALYYLFMLNSSRRGDCLFVIARRDSAHE